MLDRKDLHEYQDRAVKFIKDHPASALWIDMGLGKTVSTLTALSDLVADKTIKKTLIIAPLRVAKHTWPDEIANWKHINLTYRVVAGLSVDKRVQKLDESANLYIINRENIPWLVEHYGQKWPFDMVVIDESSSFKSHSSKRWKALRKVLGKIKRMVQLTGTPTPNSTLELWPQLYLLDKGKRLENTRGKFLTKYCELEGNPAWNQWVVREDRTKTVHSKVADIVLRMKADDYLELPDRVDSEIQIELTPKARKIYNQMEKEFLVEYDNGEILAVNAAVKINKLLQICNGNIYDDEGETVQLHKLKTDALLELVESANEPILIAYHYKHDLDAIRKVIKYARVLDKDPQTIKDWNAGNIPVLLAHPASAGHGLNLQQGGNLIIWYGLTWSLELYQQFNARLHRQGQKKPVRVIHLTSSGTVEQTVMQALTDKESEQSALMKFVEQLRKKDGVSKVGSTT